jgi:hypothetical protein
VTESASFNTFGDYGQPSHTGGYFPTVGQQDQLGYAGFTGQHIFSRGGMMTPASVPDPGDGKHLSLFQSKELTFYLSSTVLPYTSRGIQSGASTYAFHQVGARVGSRSDCPIDIFGSTERTR